MRRFNPELWSGAAMLAVMVVAAGPALFAWAPTRIPHPLWVGLFVVMLLALLAGIWGVDEPQRLSLRVHGPFGVAVLASWALVLGAGGRGIVAILLVVTVSVCPYIAPLRAGWWLIALNQLVLIAAFVPWRPLPDPPWADASEVLIELSMFGVFYLLIQAASLLSSAALLREQQARRALAEAHVELQAASALLAESTRTNERLRISRELHDLIGHRLTVLTLELEAAKHRAPAGAAAIPHIERADAVARELLSSVRATVGELRGRDGALHETLQRVVRDLPGPRVVLEVDETLELDEERTVLLVRAVQEIVTNTIRHAHARELWIEARATASGVLLRSRDDGRGAREVVPGNGLRGLQERFEAFGGSAVFEGAGGFSVTARLPVDAGEASGAGIREGSSGLASAASPRPTEAGAAVDRGLG
ncbi:sensor histidine kinase [Leucobacter ruminantium]|nr:histidine kinase [Leucobacter ruminantium]